MEIKFGKVRPNNSPILTSLTARSDGNIFAASSNLEQKNEQQKQAFSPRINDYDSNILENNAYQDIPDEMLKIEHKMGILENILNKMNNEIDALESLGANIQISELKERKLKIEQELIEMNRKYAQLGLSAKISGQITSAINYTSNKKSSTLSKFKLFLSKKVLARISKKFNYSQNMKEALDNLSNINTSVDELINLQAPYGETINRYEKLTAYLNKANIIHSQISKNMDAMSKKKV